MTIKEQLHNQTWAVSSDYSEVLPYVGYTNFMLTKTYHGNGLFDSYYVGLK